MLYVDKIVLASASKARQSILQSQGIPFSIFPTNVNESKIVHASAQKEAELRTQAKLKYALEHIPPSALIIAADQTLELVGRAYDKATTEEEARKRLRLMQNKSHYLYNGVAVGLCHKDKTAELLSFSTKTELKMRPLSNQDIEDYLSTKEWPDSVGCYRIEGSGGKLFSYISSDQQTVAGLPIQRLNSALKQDYGISLEGPMSFPLAIDVSFSS